MELADLAPEELGRLLPDRPLRSYPALLSTEADALAWARAAAPAGAVVVADYQASPRGRAGLPWQTSQGVGLGFSLVLRPDLASPREGWLYAVATAALADVVAPDVVAADVAATVVEWPDAVVVDGGRAAAVGVTTELGLHGVTWAVVNVLVEGTPSPRGPVLAALVEAIEGRLRQEPTEVLDDLRRRCTTLGRRVRARLIPMGPAGVQIEGRAVDLLADGALLIETDRGARVAVLPHHLGILDGVEEGDAR